MSLTNEDLIKIAAVVKESTQDIREDIAELKQDVSGLKQDVSGLKQDVSGLKQDVSGLKQDVSGLKQDVSSLREHVTILEKDVSELKQDVAALDYRLTNVENGIKFIQVVQLEQNVIPRLDTIENCYTETYKRYQEGSEQFEEAIADIGTMKLAIQKNSSDIKELQLMQA